MKVKEQLTMYTKALEAEEQLRVEVNTKIDARVAAIRGLIDGIKKLSTLGDSSESGIVDAFEPELVEASKTKKASVVSKKALAKKTKKVRVFTRSSTPSRGKRGPDIQRPRLEDSIQIVMGNKELSAPEIYTELRSRHWIPASKDPLGYIRYALSANSAIFLRRKGVRGKYHLSPGNPYATGKHKGPIEGHINPKKKSKNEDSELVQPVETVLTQSPTLVSNPLLAQRDQLEDPADVVTDLLKDGGLKAFGRQAPLLVNPTRLNS